MSFTIKILVYCVVFALYKECQCYAKEDSSTISSESSSSVSNNILTSSEDLSDSGTHASSAESSTDSKAKKIKVEDMNEKFNIERSVLSGLAGDMCSGLVDILMDKNVATAEKEIRSKNRRIQLKNSEVSCLHKIDAKGVDILSKEKSAIGFEMKYAFSEVAFKSHFEFTTTYFGISRHGVGRVNLVLAPHSLVTIRGSVPENIQSILSGPTSPGQCFLTVSSVEVSEVPGGLITLTFDTKVRALFRRMARTFLQTYSPTDIIPLVRDVLQKQLEQALAGLVGVVCNN